MARCEDFPCCGHEAGCCLDFDESGKQINVKCTCGATVPLDSKYSLCSSCLAQGDEPNESTFEEMKENNDFAQDDVFERDDFNIGECDDGSDFDNF